MQKMSNLGKPFCVFCQNWYDPGNKALKPDFPAAHSWFVDTSAVNMCMYHSKERKALSSCSHFQSKI